MGNIGLGQVEWWRRSPRAVAGGVRVLVDRHPVEGSIELAIEGDVVALYCHWPFDLEDDQWIDIKNRFQVPHYLLAVDHAIAYGYGEVPGISGGFLRIRSLGGGFDIEFSRPQAGWSASSLQHRVRRPVSDLLLRRGDGIDEADQYRQVVLEGRRSLSRLQKSDRASALRAIEIDPNAT